MKNLLFGLMGLLFPACLGAQNVGIGTSTPIEKLSVLTNIGYGISHEAAGIKMATYIDQSGAYFGTLSNHPFHLYTNNGQAQLTLLPNGNLGIGNTSPQYKLDVKGRMRLMTGEPGNIFTTSGLWFEDYRNGSNRVFLGMQDSIRLGIWGEGTPGAQWAFNFNARNGNVGIGVTTPSSKLEVAGTVKAAGFQYASPKTHYYAIPPAAFSFSFHSTESPANPYMQSYENNGNHYFTTDLSAAEFVAQVNLPDDATVTGITIFYYDMSACDFKVVLRKRLHEGSLFVPMCTLYSAGAPGDDEATSSTIAFSVINNLYYTHSLVVTGNPCWGGTSMKMKSVRIAYTMTSVQ